MKHTHLFQNSQSHLTWTTSWSPRTFVLNWQQRVSILTTWRLWPRMLWWHDWTKRRTKCEKTKKLIGKKTIHRSWISDAYSFQVFKTFDRPISGLLHRRLTLESLELFHAYDKRAMNKLEQALLLLGQTTRRRIKLVSRSNCFAANAAGASAAGIAVDVSLICPFLFFFYAERAARASFFSSFYSKVWCGRNLWVGISPLQIWHLLHSSLDAEMYSQIRWCFVRLSCCLLLRSDSKIRAGARKSQQVGEKESHDGGWSRVMACDRNERWPFPSLTQRTGNGALWWRLSNAGIFFLSSCFSCSFPWCSVWFLLLSRAPALTRVA